MDIILAQTAAGPFYEEMLAAAAPLHRAFCVANGIDYRSFVGVRRGFHPWQASFNRVSTLRELTEAGWRGWFVHLDADAVVRDPGFAIRDYLASHSDHALIAAPGGPERWNINDGVFFLNLADPRGVAIAEAWWEAMLGTVSEEMLRAAAAPWQPLPDGRPFPDDQHLLQMVLLNRAELADGLYREDAGLINYRGGRFIGQHLRAQGDHAQRLAAIRREVAAIQAQAAQQ